MCDVHGRTVRNGWYVVRIGGLLLNVYARDGWLHCAISADGLHRWAISGLQRNA